jgi:integrase
MKMYRRGEIWWVYYWDPETRKRIRVSTGETDEKAARAVMLRQFGPVMGAEMRDRLAVAAGVSKEERRRLREKDSAKALLADITLPKEREDGSPYSEKTADLMRRTWNTFLKYCGENKIRAAAQVTREVAEGFCCDCVALTTRKSRRCICRRVFDEAGFTGEDNPFMIRIRRRQGDIDNHRQPLPKDSVKILLSGAHAFGGAEFAAYIRAMVYTGLRMGDCATLKAENVDRRTWFLERVMAKTGKTVRFPLHRSLREWFGKVEPGRPVFPALDSLYRRNPTWLSHRVRKCLEQVGVVPEGSRPGQYCAHCLRTTFASLCCTAGVPLTVIQSWLGHESQEVTRIYAQFTDDRLKMEAIERIPDL